MRRVQASSLQSSVHLSATHIHLAAMNMGQGQDWDTVVLRKSKPKAGTVNKDKVVNDALRSGGQVTACAVCISLTQPPLYLTQVPCRMQTDQRTHHLLQHCTDASTASCSLHYCSKVCAGCLTIG